MHTNQKIVLLPVAPLFFRLKNIWPVNKPLSDASIYDWNIINVKKKNEEKEMLRET